MQPISVCIKQGTKQHAYPSVPVSHESSTRPILLHLSPVRICLCLCLHMVLLPREVANAKQGTMLTQGNSGKAPNAGPGTRSNNRKPIMHRTATFSTGSHSSLSLLTRKPRNFDTIAPKTNILIPQPSILSAPTTTPIHPAPLTLDDCSLKKGPHMPDARHSPRHSLPLLPRSFSEVGGFLPLGDPSGGIVVVRAALVVTELLPLTTTATTCSPALLSTCKPKQ